MRSRGLVLSVAMVVSLCTVGFCGEEQAFASTTIDIVGPDGSEEFAQRVVVLLNANIVVIDPLWDSPTKADVGAVYLYEGHTGALISRLTGSNTGDQVGSRGIQVMRNVVDFVVKSPLWDNAGTPDVGAATWVNGTTGLDGVVSAANSIAGSHAGDEAGQDVDALLNGNYVVRSPMWDTGGLVTDRGAVTFAKGDGSTHVVINSSNSLVGAVKDDHVGSLSVELLSDGDYVVRSPDWGATDVGAATWGDGTIGTAGTIGAGNSLVGSTGNDSVGDDVVALDDGAYVVVSSRWDNGAATDAGAITWAAGDGETTGPVTTSNSQYGSTTNDAVLLRAIALTNGHYVIQMGRWDNVAASAADAGAVTWAAGGAVASGPFNASTSLVGTKDDDMVGFQGVFALDNGNYVVVSSQWNNGATTTAGAVTWGDGDGGLVGPITSSNSLVGTHIDDRVGQFGAFRLTGNSNYVVASGHWDDGINANVGAVTWGNGTTGTTGPVSSSNSIVGTQADDLVGAASVSTLTNGNYVVRSPNWHNGVMANAGAATWGNGLGGTVGPVSPANSLVGATADDSVSYGLSPLDNGNYVVVSSLWDNGSTIDAGAATWGDGTTGSVGVVSVTNSLVGSAAGDQVGLDGARALENGNYVVASSHWSNGAIPNAGATTWGSGLGGLVGTITAANSLVGTTANDFVGENMLTLAGGMYGMFAPQFDNGAVVNAGAATFGNGALVGGVTGPITDDNSVIGVQTGDLDFVRGTKADVGTLIIGRFARQIVTIFHTDTTAPMFAAPPPDITAIAAPGATSTAVTYPTPIATDDLGTPTVQCSPPSGSEFPLGDTVVTCTATNDDGLTAMTSFTVSVVSAADFVAMTPARLADTRAGHTTVDGLFAGIGALAPGATLELTVAGRGGVAADATAATLNVTVTEASAPGFLTAFPCGSPQPTASNLNYTTGSTVSNAVITKIGDGGKVCVFVQAGVHLVVDVNGAFPPSSSFEPINPARVIDTRAGQPTTDGIGQGGGPTAPASVTAIPISGRAGVPPSATAVVLNVTITEPAIAGYATVYPCGTEPPTASNLNYTPGLTVPNLVIAKIGVDGTVCVYTQASTHLVADVDGFFPTPTSFAALLPARLLDTRAGRPTVDGQSSGDGVVALGSVTVVRVAGRGGVPANASTAVLNVTITEPVADGYATVYPCGIDPPLASNVNFVAGQTVPNAVIAKIGTNGDVCIFASQPTHLIADVTGYFPS